MNAKTTVDVYCRKRHQHKGLSYYGEKLIARFTCVDPKESWKRAHKLVRSRENPNQHIIRENHLIL